MEEGGGRARGKEKREECIGKFIFWHNEVFSSLDVSFSLRPEFLLQFQQLAGSRVSGLSWSSCSIFHCAAAPVGTRTWCFISIFSNVNFKFYLKFVCLLRGSDVEPEALTFHREKLRPDRSNLDRSVWMEEKKGAGLMGMSSLSWIWLTAGSSAQVCFNIASFTGWLTFHFLSYLKKSWYSCFQILFDSFIYSVLDTFHCILCLCHGRKKILL